MTDPPRLLITSQGPDGEPETRDLPGPGGTIRAAVGTPTRRSSTWRIWANPNKGDVYIAARTAAGIQKYSLHESGDWRYQWWDAKAAETYSLDDPPPGTRIIDQWKRPAPAQAGWTKGVSIWVPHGHLNDLPDDPETKPMMWVPEAPANHATGIHVVLAQPDQGEVPVRDALALDGFTLSTGEAVFVVAAFTPVTPADEEGLRKGLLEMLPVLDRKPGALEELMKPGDTRVGLFGVHPEGHRFVWDLALNKLGVHRLPG